MQYTEPGEKAVYQLLLTAIDQAIINSWVGIKWNKYFTIK